MSNGPASLSMPAARALLLAAQGIEPGPATRATRASVLKSIRRMGQLQIDTISVANRSPYLVLHSRIGDFQTKWLEQLLASGKIFEAWSHEACFSNRRLSICRGAIRRRETMEETISSIHR